MRYAMIKRKFTLADEKNLSNYLDELKLKLKNENDKVVAKNYQKAISMTEKKLSKVRDYLKQNATYTTSTGYTK